MKQGHEDTRTGNCLLCKYYCLCVFIAKRSFHSCFNLLLDGWHLNRVRRWPLAFLPISPTGSVSPSLVLLFAFLSLSPFFQSILVILTINRAIRTGTHTHRWGRVINCIDSVGLMLLTQRQSETVLNMELKGNIWLTVWHTHTCC